LACVFGVAVVAIEDELPVKMEEGQPLAANVRRVSQALTMLGLPWPSDLAEQIEPAARNRDADALQTILDRHVSIAVAINPESRVRVIRGNASASLQQGVRRQTDPAMPRPILLLVSQKRKTTALCGRYPSTFTRHPI
jgi:hypothetical protein